MVGTRSRRSVPGVFPVTDPAEVRSITSSASWKATPIFSPYPVTVRTTEDGQPENIAPNIAEVEQKLQPMGHPTEGITVAAVSPLAPPEANAHRTAVEGGLDQGMTDRPVDALGQEYAAHAAAAQLAADAECAYAPARPCLGRRRRPDCSAGGCAAQLRIGQQQIFDLAPGVLAQVGLGGEVAGVFGRGVHSWAKPPAGGAKDVFTARRRGGL